MGRRSEGAALVIMVADNETAEEDGDRQSNPSVRAVRTADGREHGRLRPLNDYGDRRVQEGRATSYNRQQKMNQVMKSAAGRGRGGLHVDNVTCRTQHAIRISTNGSGGRASNIDVTRTPRPRQR